MQYICFMRTRQKTEYDRVEISDHFSTYTKPLLNKVSKEGWKPECKQDVVDLLMEVQIGYVSCRRAADILFPELTTGKK